MDDYVIITPVKDEEEYIELTIKSVLCQTVRPSEWIVVDDGSLDHTRDIVESYARRKTWMKLVQGQDYGPRKPGERHLRAFYQGYAALRGSEWNFLVKLDGDLSFSDDYFERCFQHFKVNPILGIGGGTILNVIGDDLVREEHPSFHVRGATKIYRRECWEAIGGLIISPCYDTIDEVRANMLGYETRSFPELRVLHHRPTGGAYGSWRNSVKNGLTDYISGYHPIFMVCKCLKRLVKRPFGKDALGLLRGYVSGYVRGEPRAVDGAVIRYLRQQQLRRLTFRQSIWR